MFTKRIGRYDLLKSLSKIIIFVILSLYMLNIAYQNPYIGLKLENTNGYWSISKDIDMDIYSSWLRKNNIHFGDEIILVNGQPLDKSLTLFKDSKLLSASSITLVDSNGEYYSIKLKVFDIPYWAIFTIIIPAIYALLSLSVTIFLILKKKDVPLIILLINFLLTTSLAYTSSHSSSLGFTLGSIIISSCMILSLSILIDFSIQYINISKSPNYTQKSSKLIYLFAFVPLIMSLFSSLKEEEPFVTLTLFLFLFIVLISIILYGIFHLKISQLNQLFIGILVPFIPFLFFYALPYILNMKEILNAESCVIFLLLIPFNIITLHIIDQLFNITYYISRIMYYGYISLFFIIWIILPILIFLNITLKEIILLSFFIYISTILFLYFKEYLDFKNRRVLFSVRGNQLHSLYKNIDLLSRNYTVEQLLGDVKSIVEQYLNIENVQVERKVATKILANQQIGRIQLENSYYTSLIYQEYNELIEIKIDYKKIHLQKEQILWLELFFMYSHKFIASTKIIEELMDELKQSNPNAQSEPIWLKKLIFLRVDAEKFNIAQEIHDTILQNHLHIIRQLNTYSNKIEDIKLNSIKQQLIENINQLRAYCEDLKPPLLTKQGLYPALEQLARKTTLSNTFKLSYKFDRLYLENEDLPLVIYRIIQELLNNAIKHSFATEIGIYLEELDNGFVISYEDNGVGFDLSESKQRESFGLQGIQERVEAFNGTFTIKSEPLKGVRLLITFEED